MPTYDYECRACGHVIEVIHPMSADGPTTCELCAGSLRRVLFPTGIIFKGSGFYKTDSRGGSSSSRDSGRRDGAPAGDASRGAADTSTAKGGAAAAPSSDGAAKQTAKPAASDSSGASSD